MDKKVIKKIKVIITLAVIVFLAFVLIIKPLIDFHSNEKAIETAAKRYFDLNSSELPAGERVKTLSLQKLYDEGLLEKDFYIPLTKKTCSNTNSWVKVRRENGVHTYYVYLECGYLKSKVDHVGPNIILNGKEEITINRDSDYKELGVKKVYDDVDGNLKVSDVTIKGKVDTSKNGTYKIDYIAFDKMQNKTTVTRTVKVVRKIYDTVKDYLEDETNYTGDPEDNYVILSNMMFRIFGYDDDKNVILISDGDIANVNYSKIDKWLEYYYSNLNDNAKKLIVEKKYCNMTLNENELNIKECNNYTEKKKVYIPSIADINKAFEDEYNFMQAVTMSWVADTKNEKEAYLTRDDFYNTENGKNYLPYSITDNYGVRPMFTIKGDTLIKSGTGEIDTPYRFGDTKRARGGSLINTREVGEYLKINDNIFRIVETLKDGTTKVISDAPVGSFDNFRTGSNYNKDVITYDPNDNTSAAYFINNKTAKYLDTSYFVKHEIAVPIYKDKIIYGKEVETKKYNVLLSAPDMYEMFGAQSMALDSAGSYWLKNATKNNRAAGAIEEIGVPFNEEISKYESFGVRVVAYLKKNVVISNGAGTYNSPYIIK